jgi:hypothetical protein
MPAGLPLVNQVREDIPSVGSTDVIAVSLDSTMDQTEVQSLVVEEPSVPTSVIPSETGLNEPGGVLALRFLQRAGQTAFDEANKAKPLVSIPTADLISHTSFKSGSKFVMRIVPKADNRSKDKNLHDASANDRKMFFDRASLQATSEVHEERIQIFEGFDAETIFLFGSKPKIWNFQFVVLNGAQPSIPTALQLPGNEQALEQFMLRWNMDFCDDLIRRYELYYRGSKAAEMRSTVFMSYENVLIEATLIALVVARNNTVPGAANVGITFVVHQRTFVGASLSFRDDATMAELLASDEQEKLFAEKLKPSTIVPPKMTADQLIAAYGANQASTQESQAKATSLAVEKDLVAEIAVSAQDEAEAADELARELFAQVESTTDPEERAKLMVQFNAMKEVRDEAQARAQEFDAAARSRESDLIAAAATNDAALEVQRVQEAGLQQNVSGDLTTNAQPFVFFVDIVEYDEATSSLIRTTYEAPTESAANSVVRGVEPGTVGASFVEQVAESGFAPRKTVRIETGYGSTT